MTESSTRKPLRTTVLGLAPAAASAGASAPEHHVVECGAARVEVLVQGSGPTIVLLPSLGRGAEDFDGIAPHLIIAGFRVVRPEPRGIGQSKGPAEGLTLYDLAADVAAAVEETGAGDPAPAIVAGHAFGNWVARALAATRPDVVRAVVLLAASVGTDIDPKIRASIDGSFDPALPEEERLRHLQR